MNGRINVMTGSSKGFIENASMLYSTTQHNNSTRMVILCQRCINGKFYHLDQNTQRQIRKKA